MNKLTKYLKDLKDSLQGISYRKIRLKKLSQLLLILLILMSTIFLIAKKKELLKYPEEGSISTAFVKAPFQFYYEDEVATKLRKKEAVLRVKPVYNLDFTLIPILTNKINNFFDEIKTVKNDKFKDEVTRLFALKLKAGEANLSEDYLNFLLKYPNLDQIKETVLKILTDCLNRGITDEDEKKLKSDIIGGIIVVSLDNKDKKEFMIKSLDEFYQLINLKDVIKEKIDVSFKDKAKDVISTLISSYAILNLTFNGEETQKLIETAKKNIKPVRYLVAKGEKIVGDGEKITYYVTQKLKALHNLQTKDPKVHFNNFAGHAILISTLIFLMGVYLLRFQPKFSVKEDELLFLSIIVLVVVVLVKVAIWKGLSPYFIPMATFSMLMAIFLNQEIALLATMFLSIVSGMMTGNSLNLLIFYLGSGVIAIYASSFAKVKSDLTKSGITIALVNVFIVAGFGLISQTSYIFLSTLTLRAFINGIISAILTIGILPFLEKLTKRTTNFKLLELSDLNAPLLKKLSIEAPGTYQHSQSLGNLAEKAADAIEANILLTRVGAYYHDIGKINKPEYFVENQTNYNPHDGLKPNLSASILKFHVKDGVEIARKGKLPQKIINIIQEHHGTSLISYFYNLARKEEEEGKKETKIDEDSFRYPGPLPQSKEAAIVMLADTVEAAIRALPKLTHLRIEETVKKVINNKFIDSQLNECDLSLKDLNKIAAVFSKVLSVAYHGRIEYPQEERLKEN
ncbi:MAG: HDIG domain-containing metalloprotein [bacterium]